MKDFKVIASAWIAGAALTIAAWPAVAATVDVNIGVPGVYVQPQPVYVQPRPVYVQPRYESDWRERQVRAYQWRDDPKNHGQVISAAAHARNDARKENKQGNHRND